MGEQFLDHVSRQQHENDCALTLKVFGTIESLLLPRQGQKF